MPTYTDLYPLWDPDDFELPGNQLKAPLLFERGRRASTQAIGQKGTTCPCCGQHVQVYRRTIYRRMAKTIVWLVAQYRTSQDWIDFKDGPIFRGGDNAKLLYWHLIVAHPERDNFYKPTQIAEKFVSRTLSIPKYAYVYNGVVKGFGHERVFINDCLEKDFDLAELGITPWSKYG